MTNNRSQGAPESSQTRRYPPKFAINIFDLIPLIILIGLVSSIFINKPRLFNLDFFFVKSNAAFTLVLTTIGQAIVMLAGGMDLSVGGVISLTNSLAATKMGDAPGSVILWVILLLLIGCTTGLINGYVISVLRVVPFIATLASWSILNGLSLLVLEQPGGQAAAPLKSFLKSDFLRIVPNSLLFLIILILLWLVFTRTNLCTQVYAVGSEPRRSYLNGINTTLVTIISYMISGFFASLAGIYRVVEFGSGSPIAGESFILTSIAAALVGGIALGGGRGNLINAILGAFIMLFIFDLITLAGISSFYTPMFQGLFLIIAVAINIFGYRMRVRRALEQ